MHEFKNSDEPILVFIISFMKKQNTLKVLILRIHLVFCSYFDLGMNKLMQNEKFHSLSKKSFNTMQNVRRISKI